MKTIYLANKDKVCSFILSNNGTKNDANDVYQETIIAFYENVKENKFKGESSIGTYLYSIARFKWLNQLKKNGIMSAHHEQLNSDGLAKSPLAQLVESENKAMIIEVLNNLGELCKKLLVDTIYYDKSMRDIVEEGNFSNEQIARNKKYKCLKHLKTLIKERPELISILREHD